MSPVSIGVNFIATGMVVIFITLAVMSSAMWLVGKMLRRGKRKRRDTTPALQDKSGLDTGEIAAVAVAIDLYNAEKQGYGVVALGFEQPSFWKNQGRIDSLERGI